MKIQILNRWTAAIIFECDATSMKIAVEMAVKQGADLRSADLSYESLRSADLSGANLSGAGLSRARASRADLSRADLRGANLRGADLSGANLSGANLRGANLRDADLRGADLRGANLRDAGLSGANLSGARANHETAMFWPVCPGGDVIGWKKCTAGVIVKLKIPAAAKRSSATSRKCRAEFAEVLEVFGAEEGRSSYGKVTYRAGETVHPDSFDGDRWRECSNGIHFFITREEAEAYVL